MKPKVLIPVALGTNRDYDLAVAFQQAGAEAHRVPLEALRNNEHHISDYQMLAIPGGFSYGDALGAGRLLGLDLISWFNEQLQMALTAEMPIFGVCNGFQALVRAGVLSGTQDNVLGHNDSHRFECRWVQLEAVSQKCVWTKELTKPILCPVAHGEGRYVPADLDALKANDQIALKYTQIDPNQAVVDTAGGTESCESVGFPANPNGSVADIAGVCDETGLVIGLMPHPENHVLARQNPWRRHGREVQGLCLDLFKSGVAAISS